MRLLCVSDIHSDKEMLSRLRETVSGAAFDAVIVSGDLTNYGGSVETEGILRELFFLGKVLAVPGNLDTKETLEFLENKKADIHNKTIILGEYRIAGFGGALDGNAGETNFSENQIEKALSKLLSGNCEKTILVTHLPPFGTSLDATEQQSHIGSIAVKKIIEKKQPLLHLCGHCHEASGEELFGRTLSINIGALKHGKAAIVDINGKIRTERITLE